MIEEIVTSINTALQKAFCTLKADINGLAEPIVQRDESDTFLPVIIGSDGECKTVFIDDDYTLGLYHRLMGKTYQNQSTKGFGDEFKTIVFADLMLVCWGFSQKAEEIEQIIFSNCPNGVQFANSDFDRKRVFSSELQGVNFFLPPDVFLFSIRYKVQFEVKRTCLEIQNKFYCK